jgi:lipid-A-disaccharide synthase-like uncharacterized protein
LSFFTQLLNRSDIDESMEKIFCIIFTSLSVEKIWLGFGFLAQGIFFCRFFLQWIISERRGRSIVPVGFWWLSLVGGIMLFGYAIHRRDPVFVVGQGMGVFIYLRNLHFIYGKREIQQSSNCKKSNSS